MCYLIILNFILKTTIMQQELHFHNSPNYARNHEFGGKQATLYIGLG